MTINCDIDKLSITSHAERCALSETELNCIGAPVNPLDHARELLENMTLQDSTIVEYPCGMRLFSDPSYITTIQQQKTVAQLHISMKEQVIRDLYSGENQSDLAVYNEISKNARKQQEQKEKKRKFFLMQNNKKRQASSSSSSSSIGRSVSAPVFGPSTNTTSQISQFRRASNIYYKQHNEARSVRIRTSEAIAESSFSTTTSSSHNSNSVSDVTSSTSASHESTEEKLPSYSDEEEVLNELARDIAAGFFDEVEDDSMQDVVYSSSHNGGSPVAAPKPPVIQRKVDAFMSNLPLEQTVGPKPPPPPPSGRQQPLEMVSALDDENTIGF